MKKQLFANLVRSRFLGAASLSCSLAALLSGCVDAEPRDLGFTQTSDDLSLEPPSEPFASSVDEFVGLWVGSAEETLVLSEDGVTQQYEFPSGSRQIEVELSLNEEGYLTGRIVFGAGEPPPPPVDADAGYPVGVAYEGLLGYEVTDSDGIETLFYSFTGLPPFEGFEYELRQSGTIFWPTDGSGTVADGVARLSFNTLEPLAPWCELQTPYPDQKGGYSCAPELGGSYDLRGDGSGASCKVNHSEAHCYDLLPVPCDEDCDSTEFDACIDAVAAEVVNCDQLFMCRENFCECTESSCGAPSFTGDKLEVRRVGNELIGLFGNVTFKNARGLNVPLGEVRLRLQP